MTSLDDIAGRRSSLRAEDIAWLHLVIADWQIIADLAFSDLVLWIPDADGSGYWATAQMRPTTGPTTLLEDVTGDFHPADEPFAGAVIDVVRGDVEVGVIEVRSGDAEQRNPSALESAYRASAHELLTMIGAGEFPFDDARSELADSLRVGDGFIRLAATGLVEYASPNARSAFRRLGLAGDLDQADLGAVAAELADGRPTHRGLRGLLHGRTAGEAEIAHGDVTVALRLIPLRRASVPVGAVILLRDVTELRRRERQLISKEATIREIHHRVKNNLQTVAALLRLQARRTEQESARAALEDAVRRVSSIALVHETLSQKFDETVDFDEVASQLLPSVLEVGGTETPVRLVGERVGRFGTLPAEKATALAMVLTELIQNAAQHAYPEQSYTGRVVVVANRIRDRLRVRVSDDGIGMPARQEPGESLGLSIVRTLVESELGGTLSFAPGPSGGTMVVIELQV